MALGFKFAPQLLVILPSELADMHKNIGQLPNRHFCDCTSWRPLTPWVLLSKR